MRIPPIRLLVPAALLIALNGYQTYNMPGEWRGAATVGQHVSAVVETGYCIFGLLAGLAAIWRPSLVRQLLRSWVLLITAAAGLAPVTWGGQSWLIGVVSALAGGAFAALIAWWVLAASRPKVSAGT
ncbi:MAG TPA: hypothetical protein VG454_16690 [Gemmatimonadales bacterium]|nr:hypothetical protein [Gemmatimonadales bacterium]